MSILFTSRQITMFPSKKRPRDDDAGLDDFHDDDSFLQLHCGPIPPSLPPASFGLTPPTPPTTIDRSQHRAALLMWNKRIRNDQAAWHKREKKLTSHKKNISERMAQIAPDRPFSSLPTSAEDAKGILRSLHDSRQFLRRHEEPSFFTQIDIRPADFSRSERIFDRLLMTLIRKDGLAYVGQSNLGWDVGEGVCNPLTQEFLHWRLAGLTAEEILPHLGRVESRARINRADKAYSERFGHAEKRRSMWISARKANKDPQQIKQLKTNYLSQKTDADKASWAYCYRQLMYAHTVCTDDHPTPPYQLTRHLKIVPEFSLEAFCLSAPPSFKKTVIDSLRDVITIGVDNLPVAKRYADKLHPENAAHYRSRLTAAWNRWTEFFNTLRREVNLLQQPRLIYMGLAQLKVGNIGHAIGIDLSAQKPGIFDSNYGFIALDPRDPLGPVFCWLMSLLILIYQGDAITFSIVTPTPQEVQVAQDAEEDEEEDEEDEPDPPLDRAAGERFMRGIFLNAEQEASDLARRAPAASDSRTR